MATAAAAAAMMSAVAAAVLAAATAAMAVAAAAVTGMRASWGESRGRIPAEGGSRGGDDADGDGDHDSGDAPEVGLEDSC